MDIEINRISDYHHLYNIIADGVKNEEIIVTIHIKFLTPFDILILTKFYIHQSNNNCTIVFVPHDQIQNRYLESIGLINFCENNLIQAATIDDISSLTAMPIRRVNKESMGSHIDQIIQYLASFCNNKNLDMLNISIAELINNVYDHSRSIIDAYAFCQYFPKNNTIKIGVSDLGRGIPNAVNAHLRDNKKPTLSHQEAIEWAITLNKTIKSKPQNQGKGLDNINSFITANRSHWLLFSGEVRMVSSLGGKSFFPNPIKNFIGTVIELNIKINNLEDKEYTDDFLQDPWSW